MFKKFQGVKLHHPRVKLKRMFFRVTSQCQKYQKFPDQTSVLEFFKTRKIYEFSKKIIENFLCSNEFVIWRDSFSFKNLVAFHMACETLWEKFFFFNITQKYSSMEHQVFFFSYNFLRLHAFAEFFNKHKLFSSDVWHTTIKAWHPICCEYKRRLQTSWLLMIHCLSIYF